MLHCDLLLSPGAILLERHVRPRLVDDENREELFERIAKRKGEGSRLVSPLKCVQISVRLLPIFVERPMRRNELCPLSRTSHQRQALDNPSALRLLLRASACRLGLLLAVNGAGLPVLCLARSSRVVVPAALGSHDVIL
jgi:hypothetical protein